MSEIRTNILISGESLEYRSNIEISIVTLNSTLVDTHSSFRTTLDISTKDNTGNVNAIRTTLELNNVELKFYLVDMTKLNQSILYFSKFFNMNFEPEVMWDLLSQGTKEQINITHLTEALSNYITNADITAITSSINILSNNLNTHIKDDNRHFTEKEKKFLLSLLENPNILGSGDSLFEKISITENNVAIPAVKPLRQDNKEVGIISNTFISCRGLDSTAADSNAGITRSGLFTILSGDPVSDSEFINNKFLKISPLIENWIRNNLKSYESDPTVPFWVKAITTEQIYIWDLITSLFRPSEDDTYIYTTNNRGFVSNSFISCRGIDNSASSSGSLTRNDLFSILSGPPQEGEKINLQYLIGLGDLIDSLGYIKSINKNQVIAALGYIPLAKDNFKDFDAVSNIIKQDVDNWNFVFSLIGLSEDKTYIYPKDNRGIISNSFISCKGLDISATQVGSGISGDDFSILLFNILTGTPEEGQFINLAFLDLSSYAQKDWVNLTYATKTSLEEKANKTITLTAGNGLTGGGTLESNRTFALGTPSKITSKTTNAVTSESHTHEIDQASTSVVGIVKLYDALDSDSTILALTAKQGKAIGTRLVSLEDMWENKDTYLLAKNNRGIVSNSFISCKGLDETAPQVGGTFDRGSLFDILSGEPQNGESINLGYLDLSNYATKAALQTLQNEHNALSTKVTNLDTLLNSDVSGVINTWGEVVDFLDEYSGSEDLATILAGMNNDIANRVLYADFEKLEDAVDGIAGYFTNGSANNALKLGGQLPSYYATKSALDTTNGNVVSLTQRMGTAESGISTNKTNIASLTTDLSNLTGRVSIAEGTIKEHTDAIALNAKSITTNATAITAVSNRVQKFEDVIGIDANGDVFIKGTRNFYTAGGTIGMAGLGSGGTGGGGTAGLGSVTVRVNGQDYITDASGIVTIPNYPSLAGYATEDYVTSRGYITGITSAMVTSALGYTPYNSASFTKANIKSTLGIADWALAASKPSYSWSEITGKPTFATVATSGKYSDLSGVPTSLPASDVYAWAKRATLAASDVPNLDWSKITSGKPTTLAGYGITDKVAYRETWNNFMHNNNEFTFAAPAYSSYIWFNYRTASGGLDGAITEYRFAKGAGQSYADIRAAKYIVNGGTSSQFLKANGSLDNTAYLPLSGGTISGALTLQNSIVVSSGADRKLVLNNTDTESKYQFISFMQEELEYGKLGTTGTDDLRWNNNIVLHSGNYSSYALPLSGGTIRGDLYLDYSLEKYSRIYFIDRRIGSPGYADEILVIRNGAGVNQGAIGLYGNANGVSYYYFGHNAYNDNNLRIYSDKVSFGDSTLYHTGNFNPANYLPLSGGTISATGVAPLIINTSASDSSVVFRVNGNSKTQIGYSPTIGSFIHNYSSSKSIGIKDDGTPHFNGNTLYHSGNANRADVSWTASNILFPRGTSATWNIHTTGAYKGITVLNAVGEKPEGSPDPYAVGLSVSGYYGFTLVSYGGGDLLQYMRANNAEWKTIAFTDSNVASADYATNAGNANALNGISSKNYAYYNPGNGYLAFNLNEVTLSPHGQGDGYIEYYDNGAYYNSVWGWVKAINGFKGNADTATKLQTARSIWGKSFDGSGDVIGNLHLNQSKIYWHSDANNYYIGSYYDGTTNPILDIKYYGGIRFFTSAAERMRITTNGNILIGTTTDNGSKLQVNGGISAMGGISSSSRYVVTAAYDATNPIEQAIVINSAGFVSTYAAWPGIGFHIPGVTYATIKFGSDTCFHFMNNALSGWVDVKVGNLTATGNIISEGTIAMARLTSSSDAKLKENIKWLSADRAMRVVRALRPTEWDWKKDHTHSFGFIAQDVQPIIPEMVCDINDTLRLEYNQLHAFEIGAIQHIDSEVDKLKKDLEIANGRIEVLENELKQYRRNA